MTRLCSCLELQSTLHSYMTIYCGWWNRVLNIPVPPQNISPGAKRTAAAAAATAASEVADAAEEHEPEFKHKWQADIAAAVGVDVVKKDPKQK